MAKTLYCICRSSNGNGFMIQCETCKEWYHGKCVKINKRQSKLMGDYICDQCKGPNDTPIKTPSTTPSANLAPVKSQQKILKVSKPRGRPPSKGHVRKQCANPECVFESRSDSKYCSDDCGYAFNKLRYETHYIPKWKNLETNHSQARLKRMMDLEQLEKDIADARQLIRTLKAEREELERNIEIIKTQAKKLCKENADIRVKVEEEDADMEVEDTEETISADISKTYCMTCGHTILSNKAFAHWSLCHKKLEGQFTIAADFPYNPRCEEDENPKLYCHHLDKKSKRYCMHLESACPQHSNWHCDKDEVCGCPLNIMQKIEPDGNYCLELKRNCAQHYHWEKFRLAQLNMQRVQAFARFEALRDKIALAKDNLADTYGGVVGVMLHNTSTVESK